MAPPGTVRVVPQNGSGRPRSISPLHILLLVSYIAAVAVLIVLPEYVDAVSKALDPMDALTRFYIAIGLGIAVAVIIIVGIAGRMARTEEGPSPAETPQQRRTPAQMAVVQPFASPAIASASPQVQQKQTPATVIVYPDLVEGGIFGDTFIRISPGKTLKLRSMVVEPEHVS